MIGNRLKVARQSSGLSLRDLSGELGNLISAQAIGKYERNEMMPSGKNLSALAHALGVSEGFLIGQDDVVLEDVEFRKNALQSRREEGRLRAQILDRVARYLEVEDLLGLEATNVPGLKERVRVSTFDAAENLALEIRGVWNLGDDPIPKLAELLEEKGIKVISLDCGSECSGVTGWVQRSTKARVPAIVVNSSDTGERQRFTLAHELGHLLLEASPELNEEKAASRFASAFLMPRASLVDAIGRHRSAISIAELAAIKPLFGVSLQAIAYRCKDLEIFSESLFRSLFQQFKAQGYRDPPFREPEPVAAEKPDRFRRLCFRAASEGVISCSKGAELLRMRTKEFEEQLQDAPTLESRSAA